MKKFKYYNYTPNTLYSTFALFSKLQFTDKWLKFVINQKKLNSNKNLTFRSWHSGCFVTCVLISNLYCALGKADSKFAISIGPTSVTRYTLRSLLGISFSPENETRSTNCTKLWTKIYHVMEFDKELKYFPIVNFGSSWLLYKYSDTNTFLIHYV